MQVQRAMRFVAILGAIVLCTPNLLLAADPVIPSEPIVPSLDRISWAAIFAGLFVALASHIAFSALGFGVGAAAVDPLDRKHPTKGIPTMLMAWMFISGLFSLFIGGWVAGRLAGTVPIDSAIHGIITWALATIAMFLLATTSLGYIIGGTFRLLGEGLAATARTALGAVPEVAKMAKDAIANNLPEFDWKELKREARHFLHAAHHEMATMNNKDGQTANKEGKPNDANKEANEQNAKNRTVANNEYSDEEIGELLSDAYGVVREALSANNRETLLNVITSRVGVSKEEATKTLEKWEGMYHDAKQKYNQAVAKAEQEAREAADAATTAISRVAIWTFASLVFGMVVAAVGGNVGSTYFRA